MSAPEKGVSVCRFESVTVSKTAKRPPLGSKATWREREHAQLVMGFDLTIKRMSWCQAARSDSAIPSISGLVYVMVLCT